MARQPTADLGDGLERAGFVVDVHDGDKDGVVAQRLFHGVGRHAARAVDRQVRDGKAKRLELLRHEVDGRMFDGRRHDVPAAIAVLKGDPFQRGVVAFRGARREHDLRRVHT